MDMTNLAHRAASLPPILWKILALLSRGLSNEQIADEMKYSTRSITVMVGQIYQHLGISKNVRSSTEKRQLASDAFKRQMSVPVMGKPAAPGSYGIASVIRIRKPATAVDVRLLTLGPGSEDQIAELRKESYFLEEIVVYQSLTDPSITITRGILVKRRF